MPHDVQVKWSQANANGPPIERWFASVDRPTFTSSFATIERVDGQWWLILYPRWSVRHHPGLREHRIPYRTARTAKKHLEAWVRACWPQIQSRWGIYTPPAGEG